MKLSTLVLALVVGLSSTSAMATGSVFEFSGNAITQCRGAKSVYENGLRSRPLALANEGSASSFINCGFVWQSNSYGIEKVSFRASAINNAGYTMNCTGIGGVEKRAGNTYLTKQVVVPANGIVTVTFTGRELGGLSADGYRLKTNASVQCLVPVNGSITDVTSTFRHSN